MSDQRGPSKLAKAYVAVQPEGKLVAIDVTIPMAEYRTLRASLAEAVELLREVAGPCALVVSVGGIDSTNVCGRCELEIEVDNDGNEDGHEIDCLVLSARAFLARVGGAKS